MKNLNPNFTTATQSRIVMPTSGTSTYFIGAAACGRVDAPAVKHTALFEGAPFGTSVWRPPSV